MNESEIVRHILDIKATNRLIKNAEITYNPTKILKASYIPHWAPVNVPIITIRRGNPRVNNPTTPIFLTAFKYVKHKDKSVTKARGKKISTMSYVKYILT